MDNPGFGESIAGPGGAPQGLIALFSAGVGGVDVDNPHYCTAGIGRYGEGVYIEIVPTAKENSMATTNYVVSGMTCGHCTNAVTEEVSAIPGVTSVNVVLDNGAMTVESDAAIDLDKITEAVTEAGDYTVVPA